MFAKLLGFLSSTPIKFQTLNAYAQNWCAFTTSGTLSSTPFFPEYKGIEQV
jgi:hypothetical protein